MNQPSIYTSQSHDVEAQQWAEADDAYGIVDWLGAYRAEYDESTSGPGHPETGEDWGLLNIHVHGGTLAMTPGDYVIRTGVSLSVASADMLATNHQPKGSDAVAY